MHNLQKRVSISLPAMRRLNEYANRALNPYYGQFGRSLDDLDDIGFFKFMAGLGGQILQRFSNAEIRLFAVDASLERLLNVLDHKVSPTSAAMSTAENAGTRVIENCDAEIRECLFGFEKFVLGIYVATKMEYRRMRRRFLGASAGEEERDSFEDSIMSQLFGRQRPATDKEQGPAKALIDDNCVLTSVLDDISEMVPVARERRRPSKDGKTSKVVKELDDTEVEEFAGVLMLATYDPLTEYTERPEVLLQNVMALVNEFYKLYSDTTMAMVSVLRKAGAALNLPPQLADGRLPDPRSVEKQCLRIDFSRIVPAPEDVEPKTRAEKEFSVAREKLLRSIQKSMAELSEMERSGDGVEEFAETRAREAIKLKEKLIEVSRTEHQRQLQRNIRDDNEFYVSKGSGRIGEITADREAAPKITYDDVIGQSFVKCKQHVEEVIKVASHPWVMRTSAPRGTVKSNLLLIGAFGAGKTEIGRAMMADKRVIGFSVTVADMLTAYMHESVKNVKRAYELARDMRRGSRHTKPVAMVIDEFDRLFDYGEGVHQAYDGPRMTGALQEAMDGIVEYEGVVLVAMTNFPKAIPEAVLRRFKYVDVVGQLDEAERLALFKKFMNRGLPLHGAITEDHWKAWAVKLEHAPGDVIGKVADEVHFKFMHEIVDALGRLEKTLARRLRDRELKDKDRDYLKLELGKIKMVVAEEVDAALETVLKQPQVQMQVKAAKKCYKEAEEILQGLADLDGGGIGFGSSGKKRSALWG